MFEFKLTYKDPDFHKEGDPPFEFPPPSFENVVNSNLIEIQGKNGTGKTTLLNVLALALGYFEQKEELEGKPVLTEKLEKLNENESLKYNFNITSDGENPYSLILERDEGKKSKYILNGKQVSLEKLRNLEVIFLTEDDPLKVIRISLGKIGSFLNTINRKLTSTSAIILKHQIDIINYSDAKGKEGELIKEIKSLESSIKIENDEIARLNELLKNVLLKEEFEGYFDLIKNKESTTDTYNELKEKLDVIKNVKYDAIYQKYDSIEKRRDRSWYTIRTVHDLNIRDMCNILKYYDVTLDIDRVLKCDIIYINNELSEIDASKSEEKTIKIELVNDMINLFRQYSSAEIIPIIDKSIKDTVSELNDIKQRLNVDRLFSTISSLYGEVEKKYKELTKINNYGKQLKKIDDEISMREEIDYEDIRKRFKEIEQPYFNLQIALSKDKSEILKTIKLYKNIKDNSSDIEKTVNDLIINKSVNENLIQRHQHQLKITGEDMAKLPKYIKSESQLEYLEKKITYLRLFVLVF